MARWSFQNNSGEFRGQAEVDSNNEYGIRPPLLKEAQEMDYSVVRGLEQHRGSKQMFFEVTTDAILWCSGWRMDDLVFAWTKDDGTLVRNNLLNTATKRTGLGGGQGSLYNETQFELNTLIANSSNDDVLEIQPTATDINVYDVGNPIPAVGSFAAAETDAGAGNIPDGTYKYKVTFINDSDQNNESNPSTNISVTIASGPSNVNLTAIPLGDALDNCTARNIYRTKIGGDTYFFLTTVADNSTTTYKDTTTDANLTDTREPPVGNTTIPFGAWDVMEFKSHLFTIGRDGNQNKLYWSKQSYYDIFPADNVKVFEKNIYALLVMGDNLYVWEENRIHRIRYTAIYAGVTDNYIDAGGAFAFAFEDAVEDIGIYRGNKAVVNVPGGAMFLEANGNFWFFDGYRTREILRDRIPVPILDEQDKTISMHYHQPDDEAVIVFGLPSGTAFSPRVYRYHIGRDALFEDEGHNAHVVGSSQAEFDNASSGPEGYVIGTNDGKLYEYRLRNVYAFGYEPLAPSAGSAINSFVETGWLDFDAPDQTKEISTPAPYIVVSSGNKVASNDTTLDVTIYLSPDSSGLEYTLSETITATITIPANASLPSYVFHKIPELSGKRFRAMKIKIAHSTIDRSWALHDIVIPNFYAKGAE